MSDLWGSIFINVASIVCVFTTEFLVEAVSHGGTKLPFLVHEQEITGSSHQGQHWGSLG